MSDTIKKWHEMQEDKLREMQEAKANNSSVSSTAENLKFIYESPDGGKTVTGRPFGGDISDRKILQQPTSELKKKAYSLLCEYDEEVIRMAMKIIDIGE